MQQIILISSVFATHGNAWPVSHASCCVAFWQRVATAQRNGHVAHATQPEREMRAAGGEGCFRPQLRQSLVTLIM